MHEKAPTSSRPAAPEQETRIVIVGVSYYKWWLRPLVPMSGEGGEHWVMDKPAWAGVQSELQGCGVSGGGCE